MHRTTGCTNGAFVEWLLYTNMKARLRTGINDPHGLRGPLKPLKSHPPPKRKQLPFGNGSFPETLDPNPKFLDMPFSCLH